MLHIGSTGKFGICGRSKRKLNSHIGADEDGKVPRKF